MTWATLILIVQYINTGYETMYCSKALQFISDVGIITSLFANLYMKYFYDQFNFSNLKISVTIDIHIFINTRHLNFYRKHSMKNITNVFKLILSLCY